MSEEEGKETRRKGAEPGLGRERERRDQAVGLKKHLGREQCLRRGYVRFWLRLQVGNLVTVSSAR